MGPVKVLLLTESGEEVLNCEKFGKNENEVEYSWFYSEFLRKQILAGKVMLKKLKKRKMMREEITWRILEHPSEGCMKNFVQPSAR